MTMWGKSTAPSTLVGLYGCNQTQLESSHILSDQNLNLKSVMDNWSSSELYCMHACLQPFPRDGLWIYTVGSLYPGLLPWSYVAPCLQQSPLTPHWSPWLGLGSSLAVLEADDDPCYRPIALPAMLSLGGMIPCWWKAQPVLGSSLPAGLSPFMGQTHSCSLAITIELILAPSLGAHFLSVPWLKL